MNMKKILCIAFMLCAIIGKISAQSGTIKALTGEVQLKKAGDSEFTSAQSGSVVERDTIVSTGFKSTAVISVGHSEITVRPLTRLSLAEIQTASDTETVNVNLQTGRVRVDVKAPAGARANFTVHSPTATASARGTSFDFDGKNVGTYEGTVALGGLYGSNAMVIAGESGGLGADGSAANNSADFLPSPPVGADEDVSQLAAKTSVVINVKALDHYLLKILVISFKKS